MLLVRPLDLAVNFMHLSEANPCRTEMKCNSRAGHSSFSEDNLCSLSLVSSQLENSLRTFAIFHSFKKTSVKYWALIVGYFRRHTSLNSASMSLLSYLETSKVEQSVDAKKVPF